MKKIKLRKNYFTIVDDESYEKIKKYSWCLRLCGKKKYAYRSFSPEKYKCDFVYMHREILGLKKGDGKEADHINGNGLDNRIENLRTCTRQQNMMNCRSPLWKKNGYKGVSVHKTTGLWRARINFNGKEYSLKYHKTKEDAALAYNKKALELFGQFAKLNKL